MAVQLEADLYTVEWITALPAERVAATAVFDDLHRALTYP